MKAVHHDSELLVFRQRHKANIEWTVITVMKNPPRPLRIRGCSGYCGSDETLMICCILLGIKVTLG